MLEHALSEARRRFACLRRFTRLRRHARIEKEEPRRAERAIVITGDIDGGMLFARSATSPRPERAAGAG